tara:strand:+ start:6319 stop:6867 length:549 start_codon:yes stop_codon:yes gene_type:complete
MICGPNGSGKSTFTTKTSLRDIMPVVDPDLIAKLEDLHPIAAGKETSRRVKRFIAEGISFAKESTMTSNFDFKLMQLAKQNGYDVELFYVALESPQDSIHRIKQRVALGGHHVPDEDVIRRYGRSMNNLEKALSVVDRAVIIDNSRRQDRTVATITNGSITLTDEEVPGWLLRALPHLEEAR